MAAATLPQPGSQYGPCEDDCQHRDCAATRAMAAATCLYCSRSIGYATRFYQVGDHDPDYVHAACEEDR